MSRYTADHMDQDDVSQWDSAKALDGDDNLLALEQQPERSAARAVLGWVLTVAGVLACAAVVGGGQ